MTYKVVPFNQSDNPGGAIQGIINIESTTGYRYVGHQYSDKLRPGTAGCFGIGAEPTTTIHVGFVIFEKDN